jgi:hypothetical protein
MTKANMLLCQWPILLVVLALSMDCAAANVPTLSGTYQIASTQELGSRTQVRLNLHITNHGPAAVAIRRITIWDFSRPSGSQACSLTLPAHGSISTQQEFTLARSEYEMWRRGMHPRIVLELASSGNAAHTVGKATLRLAAVSGQEVK